MGVSFVLPDYWWQGPVSPGVGKPPVAGPQRTFYLPEQIRSIFHRGEQDAPALDLAARPTIAVAVVALICFFIGWRRFAMFLAILCVGGWLLRWIARVPLGFSAGYYAFLSGLIVLCVASWLARRPLGRVGRWTGRIALSLLLLVIVAAGVVHFGFEGPRNQEKYPPRATSPYLLPFRGGVSRMCIQSNHCIYSHNGWQEFAYDFPMPVGSDVVAARDGVVSSISVAHDGHGSFNNDIIVKHADGTYAQYLHLMKGGSYVRAGQKVKQGDLLGASGDVGISTGPHLHFALYAYDDTGRFVTVPVTFADVPGDGICRMFRWYVSGNRK